MPVLDFEAGLKRLRGDEALYRKLLTDFARKHASAADQIKDAIAAEDMDRVRSLAHTLKGLAGNLSATELAAAAKDLEADVNQGHLQDIEEKAGVLEAAL